MNTLIIGNFISLIGCTLMVAGGFIKEKQRMIEKSSKSEQLIIDIPAKTIKERKNNPSIRMTENRYIL